MRSIVGRIAAGLIAVTLVPAPGPGAASVAAGTDANGETVRNDAGTRSADVFAAMGGLTVKGRLMRASELGHPSYNADLAGKPMGLVGEAWLDLLAYAERNLVDDGRIDAASDSEEDSPLSVYADAAYLYHMHHSAGRFEDHGLYARLIHEVSPTLGALSRHLLNEIYSAGTFSDPVSVDDAATAESMAYGLDALHGPAYAWVRRHKPGGRDDMGQQSEEELAGWLGHDLDTILRVSRALAKSLDDAWDDNNGIYDFNNGTEWGIDVLGALVRGHKGLYEILYMFGDEEDEQHAEVLFDRAADVVEAVLGNEELISHWGLPAAVRFDKGVAHPASDEVDVAAQWLFVHRLTGGFTIVRERDGTSDYLQSRRDGLVDTIGAGIDRLIDGALEHHIVGDYVVDTLSYGDGTVVDQSTATRTAAAFVQGVGNSYRTGSRYERPGDWGDDEALAERSKALYDAFYRHGQLLTHTLTATKSE